MRRFYFCIKFFFFSFNILHLNAQDNFILNDDVSERINFEFISNLIIIPIEVNGVELSFVLDTGVSKPILFNLSQKRFYRLKKCEDILFTWLRCRR